LAQIIKYTNKEVRITEGPFVLVRSEDNYRIDAQVPGLHYPTCQIHSSIRSYIGWMFNMEYMFSRERMKLMDIVDFLNFLVTKGRIKMVNDEWQMVL